MKKLFVVLGLLLIATMLFVGCKGKTDNSSTSNDLLPPQNYDKTGTLQGKIMDAVTGAAIGNDANSELKIWLIQGTSDRGPDKLITDPNDPLRGEYAFSGIPVSLDFSDDSCFKVVAVKSGYQRFESEDVCLGSESDSFGNPSIVILDNVINVIGNIYLFPEGLTAGAINITVKNQHGDVVPDATVVLKQQIHLNSPTTDESDILFPAASGLVSSLTMTTDANGVASFDGSLLVLGGRYSPVVLPITFSGQDLIRTPGASITVGTSNQTQTIQMLMQPVEPLYVLSASNSAPDTITSTGVLTLTFNRPIILSTTTFGGALFSSTTGTVGSVTGALDATGTMLTITPTFSTTPTGAGAFITYSYAGTIFDGQSDSGATITGGINGTTNLLFQDGVTHVTSKVLLISVGP